MSEIQTSIIIVNYNTKKLVISCIASLLANKLAKTEIIIVDNGSTDSSVANLLNRYSDQIIILPQSKNLGFARANNLAARKAKGKYLFFLNSDTELRTASLDTMLQLIRQKGIGIVGCRLVYPDGSFQDSHGNLPTIKSLLNWVLFLDDLPVIGPRLNSYHDSWPEHYLSTRQVGWVTGAALLIRASLYRKIGGFNSKIFMYGEDFELCQKIALAGQQTWYTPSVTIMHHGRGSGGGGIAPSVVGEWQALVRYMQVYHPSSLSPARIILKLGAVFRWVFFYTIRYNKELAYAYKKAYKLT